jgi:glycosyltransferase involved in cell wall biosynthesis
VLNFRSSLVAALQCHGYRVVVIVPAGDDVADLRNADFEVATVAMQPRGVSPAADALLTWRYLKLLKRLKPAAYLGFTAKPNIYGAIAAQLCGIPVINNITGLGSQFGSNSLLTRVVSLLYLMALRSSRTVFFQNPDDAQLFAERGLVRPEQVGMLPGSGVDLARFVPAAAPPGPAGQAEAMKFVVVARLLRDKGIMEYAQAARLLRSRHSNAVFQLVGFRVPGDPASITEAELNTWQEEGVIDYLGPAADVRPLVGAADCVVLPSAYREGVPRSLLEAAAMGKPLITTNTIGCREALEDGVTGMLCEPRSAPSLADAMQRMTDIGADERRAMGARGRARMELLFDDRIVHNSYRRALSGAGVAPESI